MSNSEMILDPEIRFEVIRLVGFENNIQETTPNVKILKFSIVSHNGDTQLKIHASTSNKNMLVIAMSC